MKAKKMRLVVADVVNSSKHGGEQCLGVIVIPVLINQDDKGQLQQQLKLFTSIPVDGARLILADMLKALTPTEKTDVKTELPL